MKNNTVNFYELLSLIDECKAPKNIKVLNTTYKYDKTLEWYLTTNQKEVRMLGSTDDNINCMLNAFNKIVEVLPEENDEWEDIETSRFDSDYPLQEVEQIVNQLIKNQKYLKERLDKND